MKRLSVVPVAGLALLAIPAGVAALGRPELRLLVSGMRVPVGTLWLIGPMLLAVAGAVTVGWRRAAVDGRSGGSEDR